MTVTREGVSLVSLLDARLANTLLGPTAFPSADFNVIRFLAATSEDAISCFLSLLNDAVVATVVIGIFTLTLVVVTPPLPE